MTEKEQTQEKHPVVAVAQKLSSDEKPSNVYTLSTGYRARLVPVSATLIDQVTAQVKDPDIPMWYNESKDVNEPNPSDPAYIKALEEAGRERGLVAMDAIIMFGVELLDEIPQDDIWIKKLKMLGIPINIDPDDDDGIEREFNFKKYVAVAAEDIALVAQKSGMSGDLEEEAERTFRRSQT